MQITLDTVRTKQASGGIRQEARSNMDGHGHMSKYVQSVEKSMLPVYFTEKLLNIAHGFVVNEHGIKPIQISSREDTVGVGLVEGNYGEVMSYSGHQTILQLLVVGQRDVMSLNIALLWKRYLVAT